MGLGSADIDAAERLADGRILLSTERPVSLDAVNYDDSDISSFTPTSTGSTTAGTFSRYLSGSTIGPTTSGENVDAIAVTPAGELLLSTVSRLGLTASDEDMWGASITTDSRIDFSAQGGFSLNAGLTGGPASIGQCTPASAPPVTACSASSLVASSALAPFASEVIDAVSVYG